MFAKIFEKLNPTPLHSASQGNEKLTDLEATIAVHYGIPSTSSILAFDPIQQLLAIGTLDGRIKVIGGSNVEGLLLSPKPLPFKNLEFLQNEGFLVGVSNGNEIQVWDLENRRMSSNLQWESNITAFSMIYDTHYMFVGDEYGYLSVLKYESREGSLELLPYHIPPNLIAEAAEISMPDQLAIVGLLPQPSSLGNRVLIAYENGLIILWDVTEDRAVLVKKYKQLHVKDEIVVHASKNASEEKFRVSSDNQEGEKEISSLCWLSSDGSILAVGYVDGDILLWNLSVPGKKSSEAEASSSYVKLQLSAGDRRLPVIILRWSANNAQNGCGGQLFVYGGDAIGSEEALTVLNLDWSSGIAALKCDERVDLGLDGSFADAIVVSNANGTGIDDASSLFVLTNPGQLLFYDKTSLSALKSNPKKKHADFAVKCPTVVPTLEPRITVANLYPVDRKWNSSRTPSEEVMNAQLHPAHGVTEREIKMPLSGSIDGQLPLTEDGGIERILVAGYLDGSVRLWNATSPVFSLIAILETQVKGIQDTGPRTAISALDFSSTALTLAIGHQCGQVRVYSLMGQSKTTSLNLVPDTEQDVQYCPGDTGFQFSLVKSPVSILKFVAVGSRLVAGFESGQVAMLDISSSSALFVTDCLSCSSSGIASVAVKTLADAREDTVDHCEEGTTNAHPKEFISVLTRDAELVLLDGSTGNKISSQAKYTKEMSTALSLYILDDITSVSEELQKHSSTLDSAVQPEDLRQKCVDYQILRCCQNGLHLFSLSSIIQGGVNPICEVKLAKPCSWTSILKNDAEKYGLILVYQSGAVEIRSLPDLNVLGESSLMSILRWNSKINMDKTISSPGKGMISLVNGSEFAILSMLAFGNDFRIPEALPLLHNKALAAAADDAVSTSQHQKKKQNATAGIFGGIMKGLKGFKGQQAADYSNARDSLVTHLENIFSRFPFSDPTNVMDDLGSLELKLDDIEIEEPVHVTSSLSSDDVRKEKETDRDRLLEGGTSDAKPRQRTREEIIAKYRNKGDAASAAAEAKDKLLERQEKLERLSKNTQELQSGAENFADLAGELVKAMEKRKWWNL